MGEGMFFLFIYGYFHLYLMIWKGFGEAALGT